MSVAEVVPESELGWLYDDPEDPRAVTVFSTADGDDRTTHWLAVDAGYAVSLDERR